MGKKRVQVNFRLTQEAKDLVEKFAEKAGTDRQGLIEQAIQAYMAPDLRGLSAPEKAFTQRTLELYRVNPEVALKLLSLLEDYAKARRR